jgi:site-specific recombinase XerD
METRSEDLLILYEEYLARSGQSLFTIRSYLSVLKLFHKWYQETYEVEQVDHTVVKDIDLLSYRNHLQYEKRRKTATINQHLAALRSFFGFLHIKGIIRESVITNLKPLSKPYLRAPDVPIRSQVLKLFRMVDTSYDRGKRDFAMKLTLITRQILWKVWSLANNALWLKGFLLVEAFRYIRVRDIFGLRADTIGIP